MPDPEDLVDIRDAAKAIPMKRGALRVFLLRHKTDIPPRYRRGRHRMKVRVLTIAQIGWIRDHLSIPDRGNHVRP